MAQSFKAASLSLGEAERLHNGKKWDEEDISKHQKYYNLNPEYTELNTVLQSVNGKNEREVVNDFFEQRMLELNQIKIDKVKKFNDEKAGTINPKTGKKYRKKSVDKREMYAVGKYALNGGRKSPYDVMKENIIKGNTRGKDGDSSRIRTTVLQQYIVGFGNVDEWHKDGDARKILIDAIHDESNPAGQKKAKKAFENTIVKPYLERFKRENPSMRTVQAVVHYDETNPHLQFSVLPYVDGKEYGGLGSVSYTGAIINDHPEFKTDKVVSDFYQKQHEEIREIMEHSRPLENLNLGDEKSKLNFEPGKRPGSHKSMRVDAFGKMAGELGRQLEWTAKKQRKLDLDRSDFEADMFNEEEGLRGREQTFRREAVDTLTQIEPLHKVPSDLVHDGEEPANVSTKLGREQHLRLGSGSLNVMIRNVLNRNREQLEKMREDLIKREKTYKERIEKEVRAELEPKIRYEYNADLQAIKEGLQFEAFEAGREAGRAELLAEEKASQQSYISDYQAIKPDLDDSKPDYSKKMTTKRNNVRNAQNAQNEPKTKPKDVQQVHEKTDDGPDL